MSVLDPSVLVVLSTDQAGATTGINEVIEVNDTAGAVFA